MRSGITQKSPSGIPHIDIVVNSETYHTQTGGRIVSVTTDEQVWGGQYTILLDNSDGALTSKDYKGRVLNLSWGYVGETMSPLPDLWVYDTALLSKQGKLQMQLNCIDAWGLLSLAGVNFASSYWNNEWQAAADLALHTLPSGEDIPASLKTAIEANYDQTILEMVSNLISDAIGKATYMDAGDNDGYIDNLTPPMSISDLLSGIEQALTFTGCYLLWRKVSGVSKFQVIKPDAHSVVYSYNAGNLFYSNIEDVSVTIPNKVCVWAYNTDGDAWGCGTPAVDSTSYTRLGVYIQAHYLLGSMTLDARATDAELSAMSAGILSKIQGERSQGTFVAPMHCSQELFDKVSIVDSRYSPARTTTGYIHRIVREYSAGTYRITCQLGGVTGGYVPPGGTVPTPLVQAEAPKVPIFPAVMPPWSDILPQAIQGYTHDIVFSATDWDTVAWSSGTITFYDGTTQAVDAGNTGNLGTADTYYVFFNLAATHPHTLEKQTTSHYLSSHMTEYTGTLCVVQRNTSGTGATFFARFLPSYGKEPYISTDWIDMAGNKEWIDPETGVTYKSVLGTQVSAGYLKLTSLTEKDGEWYQEAGVIVDATNGISLYGGQVALRTFDTLAHYQSWFGDTDNPTYLAYIQCSVDTSGAIVAGAGLVTLNASGIKIVGDASMTFYSSTTPVGRMFMDSGGIGLYSESNKAVNIVSQGTGIILIESQGTGDMDIHSGGDLSLRADDIISFQIDTDQIFTISSAYGVLMDSGHTLHISATASATVGAIWIDPSTSKRIHFRDKDGTDCYINGT
jgi:hypothetical protein